MNTHDKLLAAARRAAKALARADGIPYQRCLDLVAQAAGRATWKAFLADPLPVDAAAAEAAAEPDFSTLPPGRHYETAVRHGLSIDAVTLSASPRSLVDPRPVLAYGLADGAARAVDARGLDVRAMAATCLAAAGRIDELDGDGGCAATLMPSFEGATMRARIVVAAAGSAIPDRPAVVTMGLDGRDPPVAAIPDAADREGPRPHADPSAEVRSARPQRLVDRLRDVLFGQRRALRKVTARGILGDEGPVVGRAGGRTLRLAPGRSMLCVSPPGTGREASVTITALLSDDEASCIVHDGGRHLPVTSGWRAGLGRVAIIRLDGESPDAINPLAPPWLPDTRRALEDHVDDAMRAVAPDDAALARLLSEAAIRVIDREGGATLRAVRDEIRTMLDHPLARRAIGMLAPLVSETAHRAVGRTTVHPDELRGRAADGNRPITIYVISPQGPGATRAVLASMIQSAVWRRVLSTGPGATRRDGGVEGRRVFTTIVSDLHQMPRMHGLPMALDLGRSMRASTIVTSAAGAAIAARYGASDASILAHCATVRLAVQQSNPGDMPFVDPAGQIGYGALSTLDIDKAWVLTSAGTPPLLVERMPFYRSTQILRKAYNDRTGMGPRPVA